MNNNHQFTPSNQITNIQRSHSKERPQKYISAFTNFSSNKNHNNNYNNFILSENQRNINNKIKYQKKLRQKDSYSKNLTENKHSTFFENNNVNNVKLKYSNLMIRNSKIIRNVNNKSKSKAKNKSQSLLKPNLEIDTQNNNNNNDNISTNTNSKLNTNNNKRYRKNISEHDLVNNILNTFTNYNFPKNINSKINNYTNYSNKKKFSYGKNKLNGNNTNNNNNVIKKNNNNNSKSRPRTASETKLFRSSSGYSYINNNLFYTNSFFNGFNNDIPNQINYLPTWGNNPDNTNSNLHTNENNKNNNNNSKQKNNKNPIIGKIIKNYKNNDLNCIFNMNLIPAMTSVNNIQDYFKNLYKVEYNGDIRKKHEKNLKKENKENEGINLKIINEENKKVGNNKMDEIKNNSINKDFFEESVEEIHYYYVFMIQNGKNLEKKLIKK